jgi:hypothetical protein
MIVPRSELNIGELDTQAEQFQAHVAIEARQFLQSKGDEDRILSSLSSEDQTRLNNGNIIKLANNFPQNNWHPQLFLLGVSRDHDKDIKYSVRRFYSPVQIREFRDVNGKFYLHHFPTDIQELDVSIGSALFDTDVTLEADPNQASGINREALVDQQEWKLYDHIKTRTKLIKGFLFQNDDDELDTSEHERKRSILTIGCHTSISNY